MNAKTLVGAVIAALILFTGGNAHAVVVDFESGGFVDNQDLGASPTINGITFSAGSRTIVIQDPMPAGNGSIGIQRSGFTEPGVLANPGDPWQASLNPFRADFSVAALSVSIDLGDGGQDIDNLFLRAYGAGDVLLDFDTDTLGDGVNGMRTLTVSSASPILYVLFGSSSFDPIGGAQGGDDRFYANSVYADNLNASLVPIPAALPLFLSGLVALFAVARRRRGSVSSAAAA
ncbi:MAG: VPLPA-CTERM sorting domain-containing protein [Alphaproteobacteria bacterium]|nr:VPLPA-CTERM sorting domain-containing protein [Alphaproteobacteria bacterium]